MAIYAGPNSVADIQSIVDVLKDAPLLLVRLRVKDQLSELRAADLRLTISN